MKFQNNHEIFWTYPEKTVPPSMHVNVPLSKLESHLFNLCRLWVGVLCPFKSWCSRAKMPDATYNCTIRTWFGSVEIVDTWIIHYSPRLWRKPCQLRTQFGVQSLRFCITLANALRWSGCTGCTDKQPGLIVLHICGSSQLFVAHRQMRLAHSIYV